MRSTLVPARFLDPRPAAEAAADPLEEAVNVPADELAARTHELPPRHETIRVVGPARVAEPAVTWLQRHGRRAEHTTNAVPTENRTWLRAGRLWRPNDWLAEVAASLDPGRVLDLGCGTGRDAVFLASSGCAVTAVDVLPDALARGQALAARYPGVPGSIEWVVADLDGAWRPGEAAFDLIISVRYLNRPLLREITTWLAPGGSFVGETFTPLHREHHGRPARDADVLRVGEWAGVLPGLPIRQQSAGWCGDVHTARVWAQRARE